MRRNVAACAVVRVRTMKGRRGMAPLILNLVSFTPRPPSRRKTPGALVGPTAGLDVFEKKKCCPYRYSNRGPSVTVLTAQGENCCAT
jgi:hypothetical protein